MFRLHCPSPLLVFPITYHLIPGEWWPLPGRGPARPPWPSSWPCPSSGPSSRCTCPLSRLASLFLFDLSYYASYRVTRIVLLEVCVLLLVKLNCGFSGTFSDVLLSAALPLEGYQTCSVWAILPLWSHKCWWFVDSRWIKLLKFISLFSWKHTKYWWYEIRQIRNASVLMYEIQQWLPLFSHVLPDFVTLPSRLDLGSGELEGPGINLFVIWKWMMKDISSTFKRCTKIRQWLLMMFHWSHNFHG